MALVESPGPRSLILECRQKLTRKVKEIIQAKPKGLSQDDIHEALKKAKDAHGLADFSRQHLALDGTEKALARSELAKLLSSAEFVKKENGSFTCAVQGKGFALGALVEVHEVDEDQLPGWFRARILRSLQSGSKYEVEYLDFQVSEDSKEKLKNHFQVEKIRPVQPASEFDPKPGQLVDGSWRDGWYSASVKEIRDSNIVVTFEASGVDLPLPRSKVREAMVYKDGQWKNAKKKASKPKKQEEDKPIESKGAKKDTSKGEPEPEPKVAKSNKRKPERAEAVPASVSKKHKSGKNADGVDPVGKPIETEPPEDYKCGICKNTKAGGKKGCITKEVWQNAKYGHVGAQLAMEGEGAVGKSIDVFWEDDKAFYRGTIKSFDRTTMVNHVVYDDGDEEDELLWRMIVKIVPQNSTKK